MAEHKIESIALFADRVIALHDGLIVLDDEPRRALVSPLLDEIGVGVSRYTLAARGARDMGLWHPDLELPATLEQAADGFRRGVGFSQ